MGKYKRIDELEKCPECGAQWQGDLIVDTFKAYRDAGKEFYAGKTDEEIEADVIRFYGGLDRRWSNLIGVEVQGKYDGVSEWLCPDCGSKWDRFTNKKL